MFERPTGRIDIVKRDTINNTVGRPSVGETSVGC
jgi:hypothetical protein